MVKDGFGIAENLPSSLDEGENIVKSCTYEGYLILSSICLDEMLTNAIALKGYEKLCCMNTRFTVVCSDLCGFLNRVYGCSSFSKNEILLKIEEILINIDAPELVYVYWMKCKEDRIVYKSGHSENRYIRSLKDYLRNQKSNEWIHSTDTGDESEKLLEMLIQLN